jgi:predicted nucleotidyltransferase
MLDGELRQAGLAAIRLFGSTVRNEIDDRSDLDILLLTQNGVSDVSDQLVSRCKANGYDVSLYTEHRYREMHRSGHLFTWHVYRESLPLDKNLSPANEPDLIHQLGMPASYSQAVSDSAVLCRLLDDSLWSLHQEPASEVYEAGLLYVISRNLAIIASYQLGNLCFAVRAPYVVSEQAGLAFPLCSDVYDLLRWSRKASLGTAQAPSISDSQLLQWGSALREWARTLQPIVSGGSRV